MNATIQTITDQLVLVMLNVTIWSGRRKLRAEDLNLAGETPPEDLVSWGSKRVCDPEPLKVFQRLKKEAERFCLRNGTRFLGGFAIPEEHAESLAEKLAATKGSFDDETRKFLSDYDHHIEAWIASLPRWEEPIRRAVEPAVAVESRLRFGYQLLRVSPAGTSGTLADEVQGLAGGIFQEVAVIARDLEDSFLGKDILHRRALGTFKRIRDKLDGLSFVDPRIQPVVDTIDAWARRLPKTAPIEGALFNEGHGLALLLGDPEKLARHGAGQWAIQQGDAPSTKEEDVDTPTTEATQSVTDELEALFGDLDDPEPAAGAFESVEAPESETDAEPATKDEGGQEQGDADECLVEDPKPVHENTPDQSFFWDDDTPGATGGDDEGQPAESMPSTRRESARAESFFF